VTPVAARPIGQPMQLSLLREPVHTKHKTKTKVIAQFGD
jgi:hypothetical protein